MSAVSLDRKYSDHFPILLKDNDLDFGPKPFKAFDVWWDTPGVDEVVKSAWLAPVNSVYTDCIFRDRLKNVKKALKEWSKESFGNMDRELEELKSEMKEWERLADSRNLTEEENEKWITSRRKWVDKECLKSQMMKQKSRIRWEAEGDENSKYFHAPIKRKQNRENIRGLMVDGLWSDDPVAIKGSVFSYFSSLFTETNFRRPMLENSNFRSLSSVDRSFLDSSVTEEEI